MAIAPWTFARTPAPRDPEVVLFAFGTGPLRGDVEMSLARFGAPSREALDACSVQTIPRAHDPRWFDGFRSGSLANIANQDLGGDTSVLAAADHVHVIASRPRGAEDLAYLQAAWALARYAIAQGATVVLDAMAMAFTRAADVQPAGEPLDVRREVRVIFETSSTREDLAHALHTRGLRKFGAPDLVALCTNADVPLVAQAIEELAEQVARGADLATPVHALEIAPGVRWLVVEDEHRLAELLQLNNTARVLVDGDGRDLMGVVAKARRS